MVWNFLKLELIIIFYGLEDFFMYDAIVIGGGPARSVSSNLYEKSKFKHITYN